MTAPLIAPIILSAARPADRYGGARAGGARRLPLASPLVSRSPVADVVYGIGRIDASGRVVDRAVTCALGWRRGDRLTLTADTGVVVARSSAGLAPSREKNPCSVPEVLLRGWPASASSTGLPGRVSARCSARPGHRRR